MRKFYILDKITKSVIYDLTLDKTKGIILELTKDEQISFDVYEHNMDAELFNVLPLDGAKTITKKFTRKGNTILFEGR